MRRDVWRLLGHVAALPFLLLAAVVMMPVDWFRETFGLD